MIIALLALAAAVPAAETPRQFMSRAFAGYRSASFNPLDKPERWFAPRLIAAIREDAKLAKGEVGYLDGDPICQCQDPDGMKASVVEARLRGHDEATVKVSIGWPHDKPRPATFSLVRTPAGWRIADVSSSDEPSLLKALAKSNAEAKRRK
jgi:hypothetical protein